MEARVDRRETGAAAEFLARIAANAPLPALDYAALVYLALPLGVFFAGFIVWVIALPALVVIAASFWRLRPERLAISRDEILRSLWVAVLALLFLWVCAYLPPLGKTLDWFKHFALINELARHPWPPVNEETNTFLRYTLAYYFFPAIAARLFGEPVIETAVFLETWIGLWLILMLLLAKIRPARPVLFLSFFLLFGGLTLVGWLASGAHSPLLASKEWWAGRDYLFAYESHATLFLWVPQHALAGLLGILLLLPSSERAPVPATLGLLLPATLLWSPFAALGLVPFALAAGKKILRKAALDPGNILCALVVGLPLCVYLQAGAEGIPHGFNWDQPGFTIRIYLVFILLQVGFYLIALAFIDFSRLRNPAVVIVVLLLLPLYRVGLYNDFTMRTCIPAIGLLAIAVASALTEAKSLRVLPLAALFAIGAAGSVLEIVAHGSYFSRIPPEEQSLRSGFLRDDPHLFLQYNAPLPSWILR
jgi:hypothetical protein